MAEEGSFDGSEKEEIDSSRDGFGDLASMDSIESRWVTQDDDDSENDVEEDGDEEFYGTGLESEDEEIAEHRLIRARPRADSFDVEALEVPGASRNDYEDLTVGRRVLLAFQTLGVVFGDVGISPLYTFSVMFSKAPVQEKEDVIGALSLVLYTLLLITFIKYVLVVLWANDNGEGGTFALYSLISRHAKISLIPNQLRSDARISSFRLKVPCPELERSLKLKEKLETSSILKKLLLVIVLAGTSMVIADGVVTPAMSVMSAVGGLKVGVDAVKQDQVVMISVAFLVILFSLQKYGTSKMGLVVGPALLIWFCCLAGIGIHNLFKYDSSVYRAFNPVHIYYFFKRNSIDAWYALGGCILCATGSEALFADLCYFSVRSVQLTFVCLVLPCLTLGYMGQAAYLMENHADASRAFFSSVPSAAFWPVLFIANVAALIASRTMTTATFSCIKQSTALGWMVELGVMMTTTILVTLIMLLIWQINIVLVFAFLIVFLGVELIFFSSVIASVGDGSWIILVFAVIMFGIMYVWNYGSKLKYETEVQEKLSMDLMRELGCNLGTIRAPGIGLLYNELVKGVPAIFGHFLTTLPAIHSMVIFVCIKYVPVPVVPQNERFLFRRVCTKSYHLFRCIARYGYKDARKENHQAFEQLLIESLEKFIRREAQERSLESDGHHDSDSEEDFAGTRVYMELNKPIMEMNTSSDHTNHHPFDASSDSSVSEAEQSLERELSFIHQAKASGVVKDSWFIKKLVINYFYAFLRKNCRRGIANLSVPQSHLMQVGMTYMV
ncbi:hypothetical protein Bca52824_021555 [Brassica carinata]|uniref:Potassium transporter n=1 Tax=Brassica carinata TaxID=52824 RepID=A0A8X8AS41_BRACI|nr:hypothetical protein Bca52824_021555 [Brassica carinata]